jgi:signal transduction histidine kinase
VRAEDLVHEALRLVRDRLEASGATVEVAGPLPEVFGDRARLVQVLQSLLDNALKFSAGQEAPRVVVEAREGEEGRAVLVVRDNGIGLEARHREQVFGLFEKLDPRGEGTGVGLAVVKRIVESHGGRVWLESEGTGRGTAACVSLPLAPAAQAPPGGATEEAARLPG